MRVAGPATRGFLRVKMSEYLVVRAGAGAGPAFKPVRKSAKWSARGGLTWRVARAATFDLLRVKMSEYLVMGRVRDPHLSPRRPLTHTHRHTHT